MPDAAIFFTLRNEDYRYDTKGKLENLDDGAGWTFIGLTERFDGKYLKDTHGLTIPGLAELYKTDRPKALMIIKDTYAAKYWNGRGFDKVKSPRIAIRLFDLAVNCGFGGLNNIIYRAGIGEKFNPEEVNKLIDKLGEDAALVVIKNAALSRYRSLRGWARFGQGWKNRLEKDEFNVS